MYVLRSKMGRGAVTLLVVGLLGLRPSRAQLLPGYTLQETVLVPLSGAVVTTQTTLISGVAYKLRAVGFGNVQVTGYVGSYFRADAEYLFDATQPSDPPNPGACLISPYTDVGIDINNVPNGTTKHFNWGAAWDTDGIYIADFVGLGAPITLNYHNCTYVNSSGLITVQILRPMGLQLPTTPVFTDTSPGRQIYAGSPYESVADQSEAGRTNALAVTADGSRLYAGTVAGVWRSDDRGLTWRQMTRPQPGPGPASGVVPGALNVPKVYDLAISPVDADIVMAGAASDAAPAENGIYRSTDGGASWTLAHSFCVVNRLGQALNSPQIVFAPDDSNLVYAAGGCSVARSTDAGQTWTDLSLPPGARMWHIAVAPLERTGGVAIRRVYALGERQLLYSLDGGTTWAPDVGLAALAPQWPAPDPELGAAAADDNSYSSRVLMVEPGKNQQVILVAPNNSNGPTFYTREDCGLPAPKKPGDQIEVDDGTLCNTADRGCGEGSILLGDFTNFTPASGAVWTKFPSPPTYWGETTPSGNVYVDVLPLGTSFLLFMSDMSHVHMSVGMPLVGGWHRLEGPDPSPTDAPNLPFNSYCNHPYVHVDPHAIAFTSSLSMTLQGPPPSPPAPYDEHTVLGPKTGGDIWMANDGGVYHSSGLFLSWTAGAGMSTLDTINLAGLAVPGRAPALYFGTGDNDDFYTLDGGASWSTPDSDCGDCDPWFADPAQIHQVMSFDARAGGGGFAVYTNPTDIPRAEDVFGSVSARWVCPDDCNAVSNFSIRGDRPMILTPTGVTAPATGDFLLIGTTSTKRRVVFRKTNDTPMAAEADWEDPAKAVLFGPDLPACKTGAPADCIDVVQAAGGHVKPVLYAGDPGPAGGGAGHTQVLWKWDSAGPFAWTQIAGSAWRFFADPYNPQILYIVDSVANAVKRSADGGQTWVTDTSLDAAVKDVRFTDVTKGDGLLKDVIFVRDEPNTRFAVGAAGVFYTLDGTTWMRLLSTSAMPSDPVSAYFDPISDPCDRALYVGIKGRGVLRIDPIPLPAGATPPTCTGTRQSAAPLRRDPAAVPAAPAAAKAARLRPSQP